MKLQDVIYAMMEGKKIKRKCWMSQFAVSAKDHGEKFSVLDILADDWEIYDPMPPVSPCRFCGSDYQVVFARERYPGCPNGPDWHFVGCVSCHSRGPLCENREQAASRWNGVS